MSHRHMMPGRILLGPKFPTEEGKHKHMSHDGSWTSAEADDEMHTHSINGQTTSPPVDTEKQDKSFVDEAKRAKEERRK